jgi:hypothetical protein
MPNYIITGHSITESSGCIPIILNQEKEAKESEGNKTEREVKQ